MGEFLQQPEIPMPLEVNFDGIPQELQEYPFVVWKYEVIEDEVKKPPFDPKTGNRASVINSSTWGSFQAAKSAYETGEWAGIGLVLPENGGLIGIDIDHCLLNANITVEALAIIRTLDTFTELSPSIQPGDISPTGIHLWYRGVLPGKYRKHGNIEMYQDRRYITVTGHYIHGNRGYLGRDQEALAAVYNDVFVYSETVTEEEAERQKRGEQRYFEYVSNERALTRGYLARNGNNFKRHYEGDVSLWEGEGAKYTSQSNADFVLALFLARVTNGNVSQIDRLFRMSGLMRPKWDRAVRWNAKLKRHIKYGEYTIKKAMEQAFNG